MRPTLVSPPSAVYEVRIGTWFNPLADLGHGVSELLADIYTEFSAPSVYSVVLPVKREPVLPMAWPQPPPPGAQLELDHGGKCAASSVDSATGRAPHLKGNWWPSQSLAIVFARS